jgi:hypothetical protein
MMQLEHDVQMTMEYNKQNDSMADCLGDSFDESQTEEGVEHTSKRRNTHGFGDQFLEHLEKLKQEGHKISQTDVMKYHQTQINDLCNHVLSGESVVDNMKQEILSQRKELSEQMRLIKETQKIQ